ncbi:hypothetical protein E4U44_002818, partial [Claviceps purpurea]
MFHKVYQQHSSKIKILAGCEFRGNMRPDAAIAERMIYTSEIPYWPEASQGGTPYAVRLDDTNPEDVEQPWKSVCYAHD